MMIGPVDSVQFELNHAARRCPVVPRISTDPTTHTMMTAPERTALRRGERPPIDIPKVQSGRPTLRSVNEGDRSGDENVSGIALQASSLADAMVRGLSSS